MKKSSFDIDSVVSSDEYTVLTKKEERFDFLVDAGMKSSEAREFLKSDAKRIDYELLVSIFREFDGDKAKAIQACVAQGVCTESTAGHMWAARSFAKEWARQA